MPYSIAGFGTLLVRMQSKFEAARRCPTPLLQVYDYLCTLGDEVSSGASGPSTLGGAECRSQVTLVWQQPWNAGTIVFFLNRYLPFIDTFMSLFRTSPPLLIFSQACVIPKSFSAVLTTTQTPEVSTISPTLLGTFLTSILRRAHESSRR